MVLRARSRSRGPTCSLKGDGDIPHHDYCAGNVSVLLSKSIKLFKRVKVTICK